MTKDQLRILYKEKRAGIAGAQKDKLGDLILIQFQKLAVEIPAVIMTYASCEKLNEYDPGLIERFCSFRNPSTIFVYPSIRADNTMHAFAVNAETNFVPNVFGIDEPVNGTPFDTAEIDLVFVPLLAFDEAGYRVGYGKGYYDRFLRTCSPNVLKIGFSFFEAEQDIDDVNEYDIQLDICITPGKTYTFVN